MQRPCVHEHHIGYVHAIAECVHVSCCTEVQLPGGVRCRVDVISASDVQTRRAVHGMYSLPILPLLWVTRSLLTSVTLWNAIARVCVHV